MGKLVIDRLGSLRRRPRLFLAALVTSAALAIPGVATAAEITVWTSRAIATVLAEIGGDFERATGHRLIVTVDLPQGFLRRAQAGERFDLLITGAGPIDEWIRDGRIVANTRTDIARAGIGVEVRTGTRKPDISTVEAFKRMLLDAKTFATSGDGSSGRYVAGLLERLGIADQVKSKMRSGLSGAAGQMLSRGEVELVVSGLPPLIGVPNIEWLGPIPAEINSWVVFTGGISSAAKEAEAGRALLKFLTTPAAVAVFKAKGLDPVGP